MLAVMCWCNSVVCVGWGCLHTSQDINCILNDLKVTWGNTDTFQSFSFERITFPPSPPSQELTLYVRDTMHHNASAVLWHLELDKSQTLRQNTDSPSSSDDSRLIWRDVCRLVCVSAAASLRPVLSLRFSAALWLYLYIIILSSLFIICPSNYKQENLGVCSQKHSNAD